MTNSRVIISLLDQLNALAPSGYTVGLHIRFASPLVLKSSYPAAWQQEYQDNAYALRDPLVFWGIGVSGQTRWSEIRLPDPFSVMEKAKKYGLHYGCVVSCGPITSRSIVGCARSDREFTDDEIDSIAVIARALHEAAAPPADLTKAQIEALRLIADGDRHTAAAAKLGISESALKARLSSARVRLGARTTAEALKKAREFRLL
ncbi:LuxR family transcriptional regulator [Rhodobacteraceae bacterium W635]|uniref:helix-turn-helix transcriptional regulator n=1 Tax=Nioella halotolerans TaxID=2303578 RepID=UPI000E3B81E2|nr:LuxR family transcriptional regulator [Rhodobacteraceae bacterium W635]